MILPDQLLRRLCSLEATVNEAFKEDDKKFMRVLLSAKPITRPYLPQLINDQMWMSSLHVLNTFDKLLEGAQHAILALSAILGVASIL